jgi:tyrosyl-tRNA synthetase
MYQYLINLEDSMIIDYLKKLTFLTPDEIMEIEKEHNAAPHLRIAHKALAKEIITDLHGEEEYVKAVKISEALFGGDLDGLSSEDIMLGMKQVPSIKLDKDIKLIDLLVDNEICSSKREAREMLEANAISLNNVKHTDENECITKDLVIDGKLIIIRNGKKKQFIGIYE